VYNVDIWINKTSVYESIETNESESRGESMNKFNIGDQVVYINDKEEYTIYSFNYLEDTYLITNNPDNWFNKAFIYVKEDQIILKENNPIQESIDELCKEIELNKTNCSCNHEFVPVYGIGVNPLGYDCKKCGKKKEDC
jgi:hypothetical protein